MGRLVFDGDYPMAYGAIDCGRDLTRPIEEVRNAGKGSRPSLDPDGDAGVMATLPEMRRGGVMAALVKVAARIERPGAPLWGYRTAEAAYAAAQSHLAYYRVLASRGEASLLLDREDLTEHVGLWEDALAAGEPIDRLPVGFVLGMEGADPIVWPEQVESWWADGLRVVSLSHYGVSTYSHGTGTGTGGGLFPPATPLLHVMDRLGMILDVSHMSDRSIEEALDRFGGPVIASHQNCRALVPGERQLPDAILGRCIERGAVIGVSMDAWMLNRRIQYDWSVRTEMPWRDHFPREAVTLEDVADHIDHLCELAGDAHHAAIGGDTDGQGGRDGAPADVDTVADYAKVGEILARRGFTDDAIADILHGNWTRFYGRWLPSRQS